MKRIIKKWMCCAFVLCATVCLVACDKDEPASEITAKVTYKLSDIHDLKDLTDITIVYTDATGKNVTEDVTGATWEKTVDVRVGFKAYMKVSHKKKENISYTKESYRISNNFSISCKFSNGMTQPNAVHLEDGRSSKLLIETRLNVFVSEPQDISLVVKDPLKE